MPIAPLEKVSSDLDETIPYGVVLVKAFNKHYFGTYNLKIHQAHSPAMTRLGFFLETGVFYNTASLNEVLKSGAVKSLDEITNGKISKPYGTNDDIILTLQDLERADGMLIPDSLVASFPVKMSELSDEKTVEDMMNFFEKERTSYETLRQMTKVVSVGENELTAEEKTEAYNRKAERKNRFNGSQKKQEINSKELYAAHKFMNSITTGMYERKY